MKVQRKEQFVWYPPRVVELETRRQVDQRIENKKPQVEELLAETVVQQEKVGTHCEPVEERLVEAKEEGYRVPAIRQKPLRRTLLHNVVAEPRGDAVDEQHKEAWKYQRHARVELPMQR